MLINILWRIFEIKCFIWLCLPNEECDTVILRKQIGVIIIFIIVIIVIVMVNVVVVVMSFTIINMIIIIIDVILWTVS